MARILILIYRILIGLLMWPAGLALSRHPNFRGTIRIRLGLKLPRTPAGKPVVWVHAASVGEVKAVSGLIKALKKDDPELLICLSTMTATGRQVAFSIPELHMVLPFPFDASRVMRRYLLRLRPKVLIIMETELWPNMILEAERLGIPVVIVNARMTERSFHRYAFSPGLAKEILSRVRVLAMAESDAGRFSGLGARKVEVLGNLKMDSLSEADLERRPELRAGLGIDGRRPVFIAGSIREGEEGMVMDAVRRVVDRIPDLYTILAPRHPDQVGVLSGLAGQKSFSWCLRSRMEKAADIQIVDTMGELFSLYGASDAAFVGGSLKNLGGQNILEPIAWGVPTIHGPHMDNFTWAMEAVEGSTIRVNDEAELGDAVIDIITDPGRYSGMALEARNKLEKHRGVTDRYLQVLIPYIGQKSRAV